MRYKQLLYPRVVNVRQHTTSAEMVRTLAFLPSLSPL